MEEEEPPMDRVRFRFWEGTQSPTSIEDGLGTSGRNMTVVAVGDGG